MPKLISFSISTNTKRCFEHVKTKDITWFRKRNQQRGKETQEKVRTDAVVKLLNQISTASPLLWPPTPT